MKRTRFALAIAALVAAPAFAQSTTEQPPLDKAAAKQSAAAPGMQTTADSNKSATGANADVSSGTRSVDGAYVAPLEKNSSKQSAAAHPKKQAKADKTASSTSAKAVDCNSKMIDGANVAPLEKNSMKQQATADGTSTGKAVDCVGENQPAKMKKSTKTASK
jgi:hypothetical protein